MSAARCASRSLLGSQGAHRRKRMSIASCASIPADRRRKVRIAPADQRRKMRMALSGRARRPRPITVSGTAVAQVCRSPASMSCTAAELASAGLSMLTSLEVGKLCLLHERCPSYPASWYSEVAELQRSRCERTATGSISALIGPPSARRGGHPVAPDGFLPPLLSKVWNNQALIGPVISKLETASPRPPHGMPVAKSRRPRQPIARYPLSRLGSARKGGAVRTQRFDASPSWIRATACPSQPAALRQKLEHPP